MKAAKLMKRMVEFAVEKAREWMRESGIPWNVEEVPPGESAAAKLAIKDLREFPELRDYLDDPPENPIYSTSIAPPTTGRLSWPTGLGSRKKSRGGASREES